MMKRIMMWVLLVMLFPCTTLAETVPPFELETGIVFGTSMKEVQDESDQDFHKGSSTELICNTKISEVDASMALTFGKKIGLYEIICRFDTEDLKAKYCISDFEDVTTMLVDRYGDPAASAYRWKSKDEADKYGSDLETALEKRAVVYMEYWNFTDVFIVHMMSKVKSGRIEHFLDYYSPELHPNFDEIWSTYSF